MPHKVLNVWDTDSKIISVYFFGEQQRNPYRCVDQKVDLNERIRIFAQEMENLRAQISPMEAPILSAEQPSMLPDLNDAIVSVRKQYEAFNARNLEDLDNYYKDKVGVESLFLDFGGFQKYTTWLFAVGQLDQAVEDLSGWSSRFARWQRREEKEDPPTGTWVGRSSRKGGFTTTKLLFGSR